MFFSTVTRGRSTCTDHLIINRHITTHHITTHHITTYHITTHRITTYRITTYRTPTTAHLLPHTYYLGTTAGSVPACDIGYA